MPKYDTQRGLDLLDDLEKSGLYKDPYKEKEQRRTKKKKEKGKVKNKIKKGRKIGNRNARNIYQQIED